ncbi:TPA: endonuclease [Patescibacteria group bacterium]|nr:endonuclease [Patescibacteria group bacterium]
MRRIYEKIYYVYILTNKSNSVLYIGVTSNLEKRIFEHKSKFVKGFTSKYNLNKLVYTASFISAYEAIAYEKKLKGWKRVKKDALISETNPTWSEISI